MADRRSQAVREKDQAMVANRLAEQIAVWEVEFDAGPGLACSVTDVAVVVDRMLNGAELLGENERLHNALADIGNEAAAKAGEWDSGCVDVNWLLRLIDAALGVKR